MSKYDEEKNVKSEVVDEAVVQVVAAGDVDDTAIDVHTKLCECPYLI